MHDYVKGVGSVLNKFYLFIYLFIYLLFIYLFIFFFFFFFNPA